MLPAANITVYRGISPTSTTQLNDEWIIDGIEAYENNRVQIYTKTGMLIFDMTGYDNINNVWRGQANSGIRIGQSLTVPGGVYYYVIELGEGELEPVSGSIIVR